MPKDTQNTLVSVIIPVYGVERYLDECVRSVLGQTHRRIEVVLVDDGSPDGCGAICDRYAALDFRVRVVHKPNGGLGDARNAGLAVASGEWVAFVDADDWVSPCFVEALLGAAESHGTAVAAIPRGMPFRDGGSPAVVREAAGPDLRGAVVPEAAYQEMLLYQRCDTAVQWRLYRRDVLGDRPFPTDVLYEDLASVYRLLRGAGPVALLRAEGLYAYRLRAEGIIRQAYSPLKLTSSVGITRELFANVGAWYPELSRAAASRCFSHNRMVYAQIPPKLGDDRRAAWNELVKYRKAVVRDRKARRRERLAAAIACTGRGPFSLFCAVCRRLGLLR